MTSHNALLAEIKRFLKQHDMSPSVFGRAALNDPGFVFDFERGRSPSLKTAARVEEFMRAKAKLDSSMRGRKA